MTASKQLRIVHVVRSPVGGIFRHIADLATAQSAAGHQVGLVCDNLTGGPFEDARIEELKPHLALGAVRLPIARNIAPSDVGALAKVRGVLAPREPDVVHAHGAKGGVFGRVVAAWLGRARPVARFYAPHGGSMHFSRSSPEGRLYFAVERSLERITDALIHVSGYEKQAYAEKVGVSRCPAIVVRNGLSPAEFDPTPAASDAADFLFLGMLRDLKGVDVFIDAIARLGQSGRPASAIIVGDGPDEARYREQAARLGLDDRVRFRPSTPARQAFTLGRAIVVPSRAESMPYVVLEAIAAGVPMVSTNVGGIPEIFGPFSDELVPPSDVAALASAMAAVLTDPDAAAAAATARRDHIGAEFSMQEMSSRIENVYRDGIENRRRRG